jgi:hypothetical protein
MHSGIATAASVTPATMSLGAQARRYVRNHPGRIRRATVVIPPPTLACTARQVHRRPLRRDLTVSSTAAADIIRDE